MRTQSTVRTPPATAESAITGCIVTVPHAMFVCAATCVPVDEVLRVAGVPVDSVLMRRAKPAARDERPAAVVPLIVFT